MAPRSVDALALAGGTFDDAMAAATGTRVRALAPFRSRPFLEWVLGALHDCPSVGHIAVVGPDVLRVGSWSERVHLWVAEREGIVENLLAGIDALSGERDVLITASDNPLLTAAAFEDFLTRAPKEAGVAYPYLPHSEFLRRFPGADNIPLRLRDGVWIGGCCLLVRARAIPAVGRVARAVLEARKSKWRMVRLLGPGFVLRFALHRASVADAEVRASAVLGEPVRFVPDCAPEFAIDIDEPADLEYLLRWAEAHLPESEQGAGSAAGDVKEDAT